MGAHLSRRKLSAEWFRAVRYDWQRMGVDRRLVQPAPFHGSVDRMLPPTKSTGWTTQRKRRRRRAGRTHPEEGLERRIVSLFGELLPALPPRRALPRTDRLVDEQHRFSLHRAPLDAFTEDGDGNHGEAGCREHEA